MQRAQLLLTDPGRGGHATALGAQCESGGEACTARAAAPAFSAPGTVACKTVFPETGARVGLVLE